MHQGTVRYLATFYHIFIIHINYINCSMMKLNNFCGEKILPSYFLCSSERAQKVGPGTRFLIPD